MIATTVPIPVGRTVTARGVADLIGRHLRLPSPLRLRRGKHARGECHHQSEDDRPTNAAALRDGDRVFTSWATGIGDAPTRSLLPSDS
jgi:hypothetical protein